MNEEYGDAVFIQRIDRTHIFQRMMIADPGTEVRQIEEELRDIGIFIAFPQYVFDVGKSAVSHGKINLRSVFQDCDRGGCPERFSVQSQLCQPGIAGPGIFDQCLQVLTFQDAVGSRSRFIFSVSAQVIDDAVITQIQVHPGIFQRAHAVVRITVGKDDVTVCRLGIFQQLYVQGIAVGTRDGIIRFFKSLIEGCVVMFRLPLQGFVQGLALSGHGKSRQQPGGNQPQDQQNEQNNDDRFHGFFQLFPS